MGIGVCFNKFCGCGFERVVLELKSFDAALRWLLVHVCVREGLRYVGRFQIYEKFISGIEKKKQTV